jgi:hypothetical protein
MTVMAKFAAQKNRRFQTGAILEEPDSAASLIRGHKAWRRYPLYGHLNTAFGGKSGGAAREKA